MVTCDSSDTIYRAGDVLIEGERLAYVGPQYYGEYDVRLPMAGRLLMPGLINAHTHSPMTLFRGLADDVDLNTFLTERVWPRELVLTPEEAYSGSVLSAAEMLRSGVTTYVDMYFFEEALVQAAVDTGSRALITPALLDVPAWEPVLGRWERRLERLLAFAQQWNGYEDRIYLGLGPHAPYTMPLPALREVAAAAQGAGLPTHIHLVETQQERDSFNQRGVGSTVRALADLGFFAGPVIAAHSVWLDEGDAEIYAAHGVGVAHCPQSNAKLGAGVAPLARLLSAGVAVGLGTDGAATNNNLDLWEEVRLAPLLAKAVSLDPRTVTASQALSLATSLGARAVHLPRLGALQAGYLADLISVDLSDTVTTPVFGLDTYLGHLAYSVGRDQVESVWVHGRRVVTGGEVQTIDVAVAKRAAQAAAGAISQRLEAGTRAI